MADSATRAELRRYRPTSLGDVQGIVAEAASTGHGLDVRGGGSKRLMRDGVRAEAVLDLTGLAGIIDYDADELVVTAHAGTPLAEVETALAARRQMLAFEPFDHGPLFGEPDGHATLGGILAANVSGSRRVSAGAARDHILGFHRGVRRGETFKGGGAVVKNVTGFDLPKLMAGSWGTLAVLVSVTVRVLPKPRAESTLLFTGLSAEAGNRLMGAALSTPAAVSAAAHIASPGAVTALRLEGFAPSVEARCRELTRVLAPQADAAEIGGEESAAFWRSLRALEMLPQAGHVLWRISLPPARAWQLQQRLPAGAAHYVFDWAGALVWAAVPEEAPLARDRQIDTIARALGGHARLMRAPAALRELAARARAPGLAERQDLGLEGLHRRLKASFDPRGILNPGLDLTHGL